VKFGTHQDVIVRNTESEWVTENIVISYIEWLSHEIAHGTPCVLILDVYPTHRTDRVVEIEIEIAIANHMELLFVPARGTGRFQPLDRRIVGELKARGRTRAELGRWTWRADGLDIDYDQSLRIFSRCWTAITAENIKKTWNVV
jgi:hypothetical protein